MRSLTIALVLTAAFTLAPQANAACNDPDVPTVRDRILGECPCTGNHGQHVSCVAHKVKDAVSSGELDVNCKGKVVRCAARSTCGKKADFRTCTVCEPGTCTNGFCDDGATCLDSSECAAVVRRCSTKSSPDRCVVPSSAPTGSFAVPSTGSCCQASCAVD